MKDNPSAKFELVAHCDERGGKALNDALAMKRAQAVQDHLANFYKIDRSRLVIVTKGEDDPLTSKYQINRRVDFRLTR
jgi:outer membrane protein OmpA-like peptidoglycan-associated protein